VSGTPPRLATVADQAAMSLASTHRLAPYGAGSALPTWRLEKRCCAELAERGASIIYGPIDRPWGVRAAAFLDPDGYVWAFSADIPGD
jgi:uncharacterized glyoxalase superfamily protein PhnB